MQALISFFANLFGYVLNFLYEIIGNYGLAIILFSVLIKLLMLPISIKQQKTMKKSQKLNDEMKQIDFKYKNDPEKRNQEIMELYKRENLSPFSGCSSAIVQILLLFAVFYLVRSPLTYMKKIDQNVIQQMIEVVDRNGSNSNYKEMAVINYMNELENENQESVSTEQSQDQKNEDGQSQDNELEQKPNEQEQNNQIEQSQNEQEQNNQIEQSQNEQEQNNQIEQSQNEQEQNNQIEQNQNEQQQNGFNIADYKDKVYINMSFLGIDLSKVPNENLNDIKVLIIPALYVISSFISIKMSTKSTKKKEDKKLISDGKTVEAEEEVDMAEQMNKYMSLFIPLMSISIACFAPLGLALYWLVNNILMMFERVFLNKFIKDEKEEAKENAQK